MVILSSEIFFADCFALIVYVSARVNDCKGIVDDLHQALCVLTEVEPLTRIIAKIPKTVILALRFTIQIFISACTLQLFD